MGAVKKFVLAQSAGCAPLQQNPGSAPGGPIKQLHDINWGAFDHASHAPQLMSCNYYLSLLLLMTRLVANNKNQVFYCVHKDDAIIPTVVLHQPKDSALHYK